MEPEYMTKEGYAKLVARLKDLEEKIKAAGEAAGDAAGISNDWHDNPAYEQAQEEQRILSRQIEDLARRISNAKFIEEMAADIEPDVVAIGSRVELEIEGEKEIYFIGGSSDSDPAKGIISYNAPLAQTIMGAKTGEIRKFKGAGTSFDVKVIKVERNKTDG